MNMLTNGSPRGLLLGTFYEDKETEKMDELVSLTNRILKSVGEDRRYCVVYNYCEPNWNLVLCTRKEYQRCQDKEQQRDAEAYRRILGV